MEFRDRHDAGRRLAARLMPLAGERPIVIALPRGGVPVAIEVARALGAPLDTLAVRTLGAPGDPEFAVAAMDVRRRTVIVVDDGLATGLTALAAVRALRARGAGQIVVAAPVGARESVALVGEDAGEVVCDTVPDELLGVGRWYGDFSPVSDAEVITLLGVAASAHARPPDPAPARLAAVTGPVARKLRLNLDGVELGGDLTVPAQPHGLVIFAHASGSSRVSPRNCELAATLNQAGFATLVFDLLTEAEGRRPEMVFDIPLLGRRLEDATRWAIADPATRGLAVGYFGASTGAAGAFRAAAALGEIVGAVVSRAGRPDLAADRLAYVTAPTRLLVGGRDPEVLEVNRRAAAMLRCPYRLSVVEGAGHLFSEPGTLETVARFAVWWFEQHLAATIPALAAAAG